MTPLAPVEARKPRILTAAVLAATIFGAGWLAVKGAREGVNWYERNKADREQKVLLNIVWPRLVGIGSRSDSFDEAPVFVAFSDYECDACRQAHLALDSLARGLPLRVVYVHLPSGSIHRAAEGAARAAICAEEQGRFRQMHEWLMTTRGWQSDTNWIRAAREAGVANDTVFMRCLRDEATGSRITIARELAAIIRVRGTPTLASRSRVYQGLPPARELMKSVYARGTL